MTFPNLAGVINKDDVFRKGTGSYAADYVSWARIANHLHTAAPGFQMQTRPAPGGDNHVWRSPDGTGYLVVYFKHVDGTETTDFVYAITDNRNNPVAGDKITSRMICDSHRRALCAAAAYFFSLGYELWAREEIEAAKAEPGVTVQTNVGAKQKAPAAAKPKEQATEFESGDIPLNDSDLKTIRDLLSAEPVASRNKIIKAFKAEFDVPEDGLITTYITLPKHLQFIQERLTH